MTSLLLLAGRIISSINAYLFAQFQCLTFVPNPKVSIILLALCSTLFSLKLDMQHDLLQKKTIMTHPERCISVICYSLDVELSLLALNFLQIIAIGNTLFQYRTVYEKITLPVYRSTCTSCILKFG